ncbi:uncharacterized protein LOC110861215 [Folsomia candida]|uniref:uncharacterized protein LOC110861215 n=1 Tax=Folsomia candida TaxID=158441 RepID=UPI00160551AF|nr:uncharacterized protein LOC110861215 [Folsomia candida]
MTTNGMIKNLELTIHQMLDKLTHSNFDEVLPDFKSIQVDDIDHLASRVFDIMLSTVDRNPSRASVFARLISKWYRPEFKMRKELLTRCEAEFELCVENMYKVNVSEDNLESIDDESKWDRFKANVRLLGELYNSCGIRQKKIMEYVNILLEGDGDLSVTILYILIKTIGRKLDKTVKECTEETKLAKKSFSKLEKIMKFVQGVGNLFADLRTRSSSGSLSPNSISALEEILQLRNNNWKTAQVPSTSRLGNKVNLKVVNDRDVESTIREMLGRLSHSNFDEVVEEFSSTNYLDGGEVNLIILLVDIMMEKVVKKPTSAGIFAKLVSRTDRLSKLRKVILNRCQIEFQSIIANVDKIKQSEDNLSDNVANPELARVKSKFIEALSGGHISLIGELYNYDVLGQNTIMGCVNVLLKRRNDISVIFLCALITTVGLKLDKTIHQFEGDELTRLGLPKLKDDIEFVRWIGTLFEDLDARINTGFWSVKSEIAVQQVLQLRKNNWKTEGAPTTSKSNDNANLNVDSVPPFKEEKIDSEVNKNFVRLRNNAHHTSKCSSRMSTSSNFASEDPFFGKQDDFGASLPSSCEPYLKYLSMYTNYDRMLRQMPPEVVEEINMEISAIIYQRFKDHK